jgi:hypothetical protein
MKMKLIISIVFRNRPDARDLFSCTRIHSIPETAFEAGSMDVALAGWIDAKLHEELYSRARIGQEIVSHSVTVMP